jgi:stage III sporulation protein AG
LEKAEGVENVEVMITLRASKEKVTLKDSKTESGKSEEETVLTEDENKNKEPYVVQEIEPEIEGILVVCSGGDNAGVQREIIEGISALFSIESHKIKVMKSKEAK